MHCRNKSTVLFMVICVFPNSKPTIKAFYRTIGKLFVNDMDDYYHGVCGNAIVVHNREN